MPNKSAILFILFVLLLHSRLSMAQEDSAHKEPKFTIKGYIKYMDFVTFAGNATNLLTAELFHNRLNFRYTPNEHFNCRLELRNRLYYGEMVQNYPGFAALETPPTQPINTSKNWISQNSVILNTTIDRASIEYTGGKWDITVGRQRINWGINTVWTPNDIFNTFNFFDFDYEERPGSDAGRVQYNINIASSLEVDVSPGKTQQQDVTAVMYHLNRWNYDWQVFSGVYHKDYTAGLGWAGNLRDAGFKGEVSCFTPYGSYADSSSVVASLSVDYGFKKGLYLLASVLYNSLGGDSSVNLLQLSTQTLSAKNMFPFRYTSLVQASYPFTPLFKGSLGAMYSPTGNSIILLPSLTYSISNNWVLDFVAQSFYAQQNNAYKPLGSAIYMRVKWGF